MIRIIIFFPSLIVITFFMLGEALFIEDKLEKADICHVMSGPNYRASYAFELYRKKLCGKLLFIGGPENNPTKSFAVDQRDRAVEKGIPTGDIIIDETSVFSSLEEMTQLKEIIDSHTYNTVPLVTLVSDPFHMRRLRMIGRWITSGEIKLQLAPVPFEHTYMNRRWWADWESSKLVGIELFKIAFYWSRYQLPWPPLRDWLARFDKIND